MRNDLDAVFQLVSRDLTAAGVTAILIGGHAVNHYGYTRATLDIDFMIAADDADAVRQIMSRAGFTNMSVQEVVTFFSRPDSSLRIDFLSVDSDTMTELLENAEEVTYANAVKVKVPSLRDLIAMKLFALNSGGPRRLDKDFPDIVHLAVEHNWDVLADLKPLCDRFGNSDLYEQLSARIEEARSA